MVAPLVLAGAGMAAAGIAGSLFGQKKVAPPDITQQLLQTKALREKQGRTVADTYSRLPQYTTDYNEQTQAGIEDQRSRVGAGSTQFLADTQSNVDATKDSLRRSLYGNTFSGAPATLQAVREAGAAGAGVGSGAYLKGVQNVGTELATKLASGEQAIQTQGLQSVQDARAKTYEVFSNLESKLGSANLDRIANVMSTGRTDELARLSTEMGLNSEETQGLIDLMNFQASGKFASDSAAAEQRAALWNNLTGGGMSLMGKGGGVGTGVGTVTGAGQTGSFNKGAPTNYTTSYGRQLGTPR